MTAAVAHFREVMRPVLGLASSDYVEVIASHLRLEGVRLAVSNHDTPVLFDWIVSQLSFQGISDRAALSYDAHNGGIRWRQIEKALERPLACRKLRSYWHFEACGYQKGGTCREPEFFDKCPLPKHRLRKGTLNQGAYSLFLFLRDVCDGDFIAWIDQRLAGSGDTSPDCSALACEALIEPLCNIYGMGAKLWNMIMASLLLAGDPARRRWVEAGASMIAVDSLVHNFLHRTGILQRFDACHPYGPRCYAAGGCADTIAAFASDFDARDVNSQFAKYFPRLIQHAIWAFCAEGGWNICNGRQIDDRVHCLQTTCPLYSICERVPLKAREG